MEDFARTTDPDYDVWLAPLIDAVERAAAAGFPELGPAMPVIDAAVFTPAPRRAS